jgi:hypothetical protein
MTTLRASPYLYALNGQARVKIWAENIMGAGSASILYISAGLNNAKIQTPPYAPTTLI